MVNGQYVALKAGCNRDNKCTNWVIDSGATCHMTHNISHITNYVKFSSPRDVKLGDGNVVDALGYGDVLLSYAINDFKGVLLKDVLFVPLLSTNLFSIPICTAKGFRVCFDECKCEVTDGSGKVITTGKHTGKLYYLNDVGEQANAHEQVNAASDLSLWHRRLGHLGVANVKRLINGNMVEGVKGKLTGDIGVCGPCAYGKQHRTPFPDASKSRSDSVLGLVHTDVCGRMEVRSISGSEYFVTFIDDKTRYIWVFFLKQKSEVFKMYRQWRLAVELEHGVPNKKIRSDNGGEYTSTEFEEYLANAGKQHDTSVPDTPEQNGVAERANRTLVETARCMLNDAGLPKKYWAEAVNTAVHLRNRSPTVAVTGVTPYEALYGVKPQVSALKVFGATGYAHIPKDKRRKWDVKSRKVVFLGYAHNTKGYRCLDPATGKIIITRDLVLDESSPATGNVPSATADVPQATADVPADVPDVEDDVSVSSDSDVDGDEVDQPQGGEVVGDAAPPPPADAAQRPERERRPPDMYGDWAMTAHSTEPKSYREALVSPDKAKWVVAMEQEMQSLHDNEAWTLTELPKGRKAVGSKWTFKEKRGADGNITRYKARLVAQGFSQQYGKDYDETFSPVVRSESVRSVIALAAQRNLVVHQMDVSTAFLNGKLQEEVFMRQPDGFQVSGKEDLVCRLHKSIYGLKQSSRCWNFELHSYLVGKGFIQSANDPCIYIYPDGKRIVAVYVDDLVLATPNLKVMSILKASLSDRFSVTDLGEFNFFLGVRAEFSDEYITLRQDAYTERILSRFGMENCKPVSTPADPAVKLVPAADGETTVDSGMYQSAVGSLLYLSIWTRPDIAYAVSSVAKYSGKPTQTHYTAVKRIFRYLRGTVDFGLCFPRTDNPHVDLVGYSDSDWAGDVGDRRSTSGYLFKIGDCAVSWRSRKQSVVALSSAEAEYIALASGAQESVWLSRVVLELTGGSGKACSVMHVDNQSAIAMAKNPQFHGRGKHIAIKYHFIRE